MFRLTLLSLILLTGPAFADAIIHDDDITKPRGLSPRFGTGVAVAAAVIAVGLIAARMARRRAV